MSYYIYRYVHPNYPWLYVGQTVNLEQRIYSHDNNNSDNIPRAHEKELRESSVFYFECNSKRQMDYIESYLIDKHKPRLNVSQKNEKVQCDVEMKLPEWIIYRKSDSKKYEHQFELLVDDINQKSQQLDDLETRIKEKTDELSSLKQEITKMECAKNIDISFDNKWGDQSMFVPYDEITEFYKAYPNSKIQFSAKIYSQIGEESFIEIGYQSAKVVNSEGLVFDSDALINQNDTSYCRKGELSLTGTLLASHFNFFNNGFVPSSSLFFSLMVAHYSDMIAKTAKELEIKETLPLFYKKSDINKEGWYDLCDSKGNKQSFLKVTSVRYEFDKRQTLNLTGLCIDDIDSHCSCDFDDKEEMKKYPYSFEYAKNSDYYVFDTRLEDDILRLKERLKELSDKQTNLTNRYYQVENKSVSA